MDSEFDLCVFSYGYLTMSPRVVCKHNSVCLCIHLLGCTGGLDEYLEQRSACDSACTVWARIQPGQPSGDQSGSDYDVTAAEPGAPQKLGGANNP